MRRMILSLLLILSGVWATGVHVHRGYMGDAKAIYLSNQYLRVGIVPATVGGVVSLNYLPTGKELMPVFEYEEDDLLPIPTINGGGGRTVLWGHEIFLAQQLKISKIQEGPEQGTVEMITGFFQCDAFDFQRKITLNMACAVLKVTASLTNKDMKSRRISLWENTLARLDDESMDTVILPSRGQMHSLNGRQNTYFPEEQLVADGVFAGQGEIKMLPCRGWIAQINARSALVLVLRTKREWLARDGFFYSYKSQSHPPVHTMEIVFDSFLLKPGETRTVEYEYLIFHGLNGIKEVVGDWALDCHCIKNSLVLDLATACQVPRGALTLALQNGAGRTYPLAQGAYETIRPGEVRKLMFDLPKLPPGTYTIRGWFKSGETFCFVEPKVVIGEERL